MQGSNFFKSWHDFFFILEKNHMKKIYSLLFAIAVSAASYAQMAIPGETFSLNPSRFNGRLTTIKNIEIVKGLEKSGPQIGGTAGSLQQGAPGPIGSPTSPATAPCRPPRGYSQVDIFFKGDPQFKGCFFMVDAMKAQMERDCALEKTPAQITFRGDSRTGYHITFYRIGN
jgi:hypothetical protein